MHIAICGELGAGCTEVGQALSKKLGVKCVSSADIVKNIVSGFGEDFKEFEHHIHSGEIDLDRMIDSEVDNILALGDTIVEGRSAFMLLDNESVFKVLLVAPQSRRAEHLAKRRSISIDEAKEALRVSDIERKHMVERLFKKEWLDPHNYDMTVNTGLRGYEETADLIIRTIQEKSVSK